MHTHSTSFQLLHLHTDPHPISLLSVFSLSLSLSLTVHKAPLQEVEIQAICHGALTVSAMPMAEREGGKEK